MPAPRCECGKPAIRAGNYWICDNPGCPGFRQICRELTKEEKEAKEAAKNEMFSRLYRRPEP
jgi:hypothetical protein